MPLVSIKLLPGRSAEQKNRLNKAIVEAFEREMSVPAEAIWTVFEEVDADDWFMGEQSLAERRRQSD